MSDTDAIFGGGANEIFGGDCGGCGSESNSIFGGAFRAISHLSDGGQMQLGAWLSLGLSVAALLVLIILILPWASPDSYKSLLAADNVAGKFATWLSNQDLRYLMGTLGAYFVWSELNEWHHWK